MNKEELLPYECLAEIRAHLSLSDATRWGRTCTALCAAEGRWEAYDLPIPDEIKIKLWMFMGKRLDRTLPHFCGWGKASGFYHLDFEPDYNLGRPRLRLAWVGDRWLVRWYATLRAEISFNRAVHTLAQMPELLDPRTVLEGTLPSDEAMVGRGSPIRTPCYQSSISHVYRPLRLCLSPAHGRG